MTKYTEVIAHNTMSASFAVAATKPPAKPGWMVMCTDKTAFFAPQSAAYAANSAIFETKAQADAYCDRLNKVFGTKED